METNLKELDGCKREFEAILNYDELTPHFEKAYEKYRKKATIPGFRKGKAPLAMIKKRFGESIEYGSLEDIANEVFTKHIIDNKIDMLGHGKMTDIDYEPKDKFTFKVEFEVKPDIKLDSYKGFELTKKKYVIDDSLVDEEVNYHRLNNSDLAMDAEALDDDYVVTADVQVLDEGGSILIGQGQKDVKLFLGNKDLLPEFKAGLQGIKEGESRDIETRSAGGGKDGNSQRVRLTAKKVEKIVYPELNEEFFKKVTHNDDIKTEDEFRSSIKEELEKVYNENAERSMHNELISEVVKNNEIEVPEAFVDAIQESILNDYKKQLPKNYELTTEQIEEFKKSRRADAVFQAKWFLIREKIAELENITAEEKDFLELAEENAKRFNIPADKLVEIYKDNSDIKSNIVSKKVLDFLAENSKITEEEEVKKFEPHKHDHEHEHDHQH